MDSNSISGHIFLAANKPLLAVLRTWESTFVAKFYSQIVPKYSDLIIEGILFNPSIHATYLKSFNSVYEAYYKPGKCKHI